MTFYEAIVPVCLQMYSEGKIALSSSTEWGFTYTRFYDPSVESLCEKVSGEVYEYDLGGRLYEECKKAAAICKLIENSPLAEALA